MYKLIHVVKALHYLKSGEILPANEAYNIERLGFSTDCYKAVSKAMHSLYGMRYAWPKAVNTKALMTEVNK